MNWWRRFLAGLLIAGGVLVGAYLTRGCWLPAMARWLDVGRRPRPADYVMVLCGDADTRPFVGAALVKAGLARKVLVAAVQASPDVEDGIVPPAHETIRRVLVRRGVPRQDVVILDGQARHTHDEARSLATFLESSPDARVTVVTSNFHTRRARWIFRRVLGDRAAGVRFVSAPAYGIEVETWWQVEDGVRFVLGEYLKLTFYGVRYGRLCYVVAAAAALILAILVYRRRRRAVSPSP